MRLWDRVRIVIAVAIETWKKLDKAKAAAEESARTGEGWSSNEFSDGFVDLYSYVLPQAADKTDDEDSVITPGEWYVGERTLHKAEVTMIRTTYDTSGVVGMCSSRDAPVVAAAVDLKVALQLADRLIRAYRDTTGTDSPWTASVLQRIECALEKADGKRQLISSGTEDVARRS